MQTPYIVSIGFRLGEEGVTKRKFDFVVTEIVYHKTCIRSVELFETCKSKNNMWDWSHNACM